MNDAGGLWPPEGTPEDVVVDHLSEVTAFLGPPGAGRGRRPPGDAAACHLPVRMFPNDRHRFVVTRELRLDQLEGLRRIDDEEERLAVAEQVAAREAALDPSELPGWWRPWAESIADNLRAHPGTLDEPERMVFGMLVQVAEAFLGGDLPTEPGYFHAGIGEEPPCDDGDVRDGLGITGRSLLIPEQRFPGASFDMSRITAFVRDASPVTLAGSAAAFYPALVQLRTKLDVHVSETHTKMAAAILGPAIAAMSADQPICAISGMHPVARGGPPVCVFCGASAAGQPALTI
jgi:hypothetical protein